MSGETATPEKRGILSFFQQTAAVKSVSRNNSQNNDTITFLDPNKTIGDVVTEGSSLIILDNETNEESDDTNISREIDETDLEPTEKNEKSSTKLEDSSDKIETQFKIEEGHTSKGDEKDENISRKDTLKKQREERRALLKKQKEEEKSAERKKKEEEKLILKKKKEEEKLKREEEKLKIKLQREEEKRKKEEEKLKVKQQRETERRKKEEEKRKREEEKKLQEQAKERSQSRIANFFKKVSDSSKQESQKSDYETSFLPFYARDGVIMPTDLILTKDDFAKKKALIDEALSKPVTELNNKDIQTWLSSRIEKRGGLINYKAVTLLQQMTAKEKSDKELQVLLSMVPQKYIKFYENVRPPYIGTYSKDTILPINEPFSTEGTGYNYDYDSDLEWVNEEEDADGAGIDNLESGDEDDEEEEDDDEGSENEFDGFLDEEDSSPGSGKKKFIGPLIPTVLLRINIESMESDDKNYFDQTGAESLVQDEPLPIDPHKKIRVTSALVKSSSQSSLKRALGDATENNTSASESPEKKTKTLITESKDLLKLFDEIQDSTFSLGTVTEISQKSLPNYNKQTIKNTVKEYAARGTGKGDSSRKWQIKDMAHWEELRNSI